MFLVKACYDKETKQEGYKMTKAFKDMTERERNSYIDGKAQEKVVVQLLESVGFENVLNGTREQDIYHDIDLVGRYGGEVVTISVKANTPKYFSADFVFELGVTYANHPEKFVPSWFNTGKADYYAVYKRHHSGGGELYLINKAELLDFVAINGWKKRTTQKPFIATAQQEDKGIAFTYLALGCRQQFIASGVAKLIASNIGGAVARETTEQEMGKVRERKVANTVKRVFRQ